MLVDLIIVALALATAAWGFRSGFSAGGLGLIGFGVGVVAGSRLAPLILDGGLRDPYAPVIALPAALLFGAVLAAVLERFAHTLRRPLLRYPTADGVVGALVAACLGLAMVWAVGAAAARVDAWRGTVRDSTVIENLNSLVSPAGPLLSPQPEFESLPTLAGPAARVRAPNTAIRRDPEVRRARSSVVKVTAVACGHQSSGSGWIARDGVVVTNAHVVAGSEDMRVQWRGVGRLLEARATGYDAAKDVAVLRTPGLAGRPALPIASAAKPGTLAAVLGFPRAGAYRIRASRIGSSARVSGRRVEGKFIRRRVTSIRAFIRPGNSGGPVVDGDGRIVTMIFSGRKGDGGGKTAYGVTVADVRKALRRARGTVDTGDCPEDR